MKTLKIIEAYRDGDIDANECAYRIKNLTKELEDEIHCIKSFKHDLIDDLRAFKDEMPDGYKGMDVEVRTGRLTYNFSNVEEVVWLKKQLKEAEEKYKAAFKQFQNGIVPVQENTGEVLDLPEVKRGADVLILKDKR